MNKRLPLLIISAFLFIAFTLAVTQRPMSYQPIVTHQTTASIASAVNSLEMTLLFAAFAAAWFGGWLIVKYDHLHAHLSHDQVGVGPQKYHAQPTPRVGGIAVMLGLLIGGCVIFGAKAFPVAREFGFLLLAGAPAFVGGIVEDITKKVGVLERLLLTILSGTIAAWLLVTVLNRIDVPGLDQALMWLPFAVVLTSFCIGGIANAINIIDGYNGLVGGFSLLVLAALGYVAVQVGDQLVLTSSIAMAGALLGFSIWNYPRGKMFLGDGGAYFLGFWLGELSVLLVARNPEVSPWFPVALLSYPIYEIFFSIYRKKFLRGHSPGKPDGLHLQMLIYKRIVRFFVLSRDPALRTVRNSLVAPYIWIVSIFFFTPALFFWNQTRWLAALTLIFCVGYTWLYWRMVKWKTPRWLIIRQK